MDSPGVAYRLNLVLRAWSEVFMSRSMHEFMRFSKASGLSMTQVSTLFRLYHGTSCGISDISDHLGVSNPAASQMVDRMVQQGLLERFEDPGDRRVKQVLLTAQGRQFVDDLVESRRLWLEKVTQVLPAEQQESISDALFLLTQAARSLEEIESSNVVDK